MNLTYEYRLYVRRGERDALSRLLEEHRTVYNAALSQLKTAYEVGGERQTALGQWSYFREWRKQGGLLANASSVQQTLRRLDKAFGAFFRRVKAGETPGYPRFQGANRWDSVEYTYGDGVKLYYNEAYDRFLLHVQNVGDIKVKLHRGELVPKALSVRVHSCPHCHLQLDRDVNAAINILALALQRPPGSGGQGLT